jgi:hypothetical protein
LLPSRFIVYKPSVRVKTILVPSGDHDGSKPAASVVIAPPDAGIVVIALPPVRSLVKAIVLPSRLHAGWLAGSELESLIC